MLDDPDSFDVNKIADSLDSATAAVCISHIQYLTGNLLDPDDLATLAHDHGALLIVDATQSAGQVPIDVTASGVDVLITESVSPRTSTTAATTSATPWRPSTRSCDDSPLPRREPHTGPAAVTIAPATESTVDHARKHQSRGPAHPERSIADGTPLL